MCKNEISSIISKSRINKYERLEAKIESLRDELNCMQNKNERLEVNIRIQQSDIIQLRKVLTLLMDIKKVSPEDMKQLEFMRSIGEI